MSILRIRDKDGNIQEILTLKGDKGDPGAQGKDGKPGADGVPGYTPQKFVDYWTLSDQTSVINQAVSGVEAKVAPVSYESQTLTSEQQAQARENIGAAEVVFVYIINYDEETSTYYCDKTAKDIFEYLKDGKAVYLRNDLGDSGLVYALVRADEDYACFSDISVENYFIQTWSVNNNGVVFFETADLVLYDENSNLEVYGEPTEDYHVVNKGYVDNAVKDKPYELIETITLTEEVSAIFRNTEPNGTYYNLERCFIRANFPAATSKTGNLCIDYTLGDWKNGKGLRSYMLSPFGTANNKTGFSMAWLDHDRWMTGIWTCAVGHGDLAARHENPVNQCAYSIADGDITQININYGAGMAVGTTFEIWGIRAGANATAFPNGDEVSY